MGKPFTITVQPISPDRIPADHGDIEFVYEVKCSVILNVACPPWDPSLELSLVEHIRDRIEAGGTDDMVDAVTLIDVVFPREA